MTILTSPSVSSIVNFVILFVFLTLSTEPGERPDMDKILSIYLSTTVLEELPYVVGYCGEFHESITQWAGPHWIPGLSIFSFLKFSCSDQLSQAHHGTLLTTI